MEAISSSLSDPSWWFSGLFFAAIGCLLPFFFKHSLRLIRITFRGAEARSRKKIKNTRQDALLITAAVVRANAYFVAFILSVLGLLAAIGIIGAVNHGRVPVSIWIWTAPVLVVELIWLSANDFAKSLLREHVRRARLQRTKSV